VTECDCWLWMGTTIFITLAGFIGCHHAYRGGVLDGAYNQFLPRVRRIMKESDL
jgi:hypothetical protein